MDISQPSSLSGVSFIVNSMDDRRFNRLVDNFRQVFTCQFPEIVRISDARSMAEGLNRGVKIAKGDWLIFCHDDILIVGADIENILLSAMAQSDMFGPCGTTRLVSGNWYDAGRPYTYGQVIARDMERVGKFELQVFGVPEQPVVSGAQALDGLWIGCRRSLFDALRGFNSDIYQDFMGYDIDFSFRAALAGARVCVTCDLMLFHDSHVGEFSQDKIEKWEACQREFESMFERYIARCAGERGHETFQLDDLSDCFAAMALFKSEASHYSSRHKNKFLNLFTRFLKC